MHLACSYVPSGAFSSSVLLAGFFAVAPGLQFPAITQVDLYETLQGQLRFVSAYVLESS